MARVGVGVGIGRRRRSAAASSPTIALQADMSSTTSLWWAFF